MKLKMADHNLRLATKNSVTPTKIDRQSKDLNTITNTLLLFISGGGKRYLVTARGFSLISPFL